MEKIIFRNSTNVKFQQLKNGISKDKNRPHLSGVFVDYKNEKIVVTDSKVLIAYDIEILSGSKGLEEGAILDPKIFNQSNWLSVPKEDLELVEFHVTKEKTEVMLGEDIVAVSKNVDCESSFPQWKHVLNDDSERSEFLASAEVVKKLMSAIPPNFGFPKFHIGSKLTISSEVDDPDFGLLKIFGIAMLIGFEEEAITDKSVEVKINRDNDGKVYSTEFKKVKGKRLSRRVLNSWMEDFVDEDTSEVVSIERNEIVVDKDVIIDAEVFEIIAKNKNVDYLFIHKYN